MGPRLCAADLRSPRTKGNDSAHNIYARLIPHNAAQKRPMPAKPLLVRTVTLAAVIRRVTLDVIVHYSFPEGGPSPLKVPLEPNSNPGPLWGTTDLSLDPSWIRPETVALALRYPTPPDRPDHCVRLWESNP